MSEPKGFIDSTKPDFMYKLHKTLYGINLAPRAWYNKLKSCLLHWGFIYTSSNTSMFLRRSQTFIILILLYIDDILIIRTSSVELESFAATFSKAFL